MRALERGASIPGRAAGQAARNREWFFERDMLAVTIAGPPGAGKTALIEASAKALDGRRSLGAIAGKVDPRALDRLRVAGVRAVALDERSRRSGDAQAIQSAVQALAWTELDYVLILDAVGRPAPAVCDVGQAASVAVLPAAGLEHPPADYAVLLEGSDLVLITKADLVAGVDAIAAIRDGIAAVAPGAAVHALSARTGEGLPQWLAWLRAQEVAVAPGPFGRDCDAG